MVKKRKKGVKVRIERKSQLVEIAQGSISALASAIAQYVGGKELIAEFTKMIDGLGSTLGKKIDGVGEKINGLGKKIDVLGEKVDGLGKKIDVLGEKVDGLGKKIDVLGEKIDGLSQKMDTFAETQKETLNEIKNLRQDLKLKM